MRTDFHARRVGLGGMADLTVTTTLAVTQALRRHDVAYQVSTSDIFSASFSFTGTQHC